MGKAALLSSYLKQYTLKKTGFVCGWDLMDPNLLKRRSTWIQL
jgi:hypothetical protein